MKIGPTCVTPPGNLQAEAGCSSGEGLTSNISIVCNDEIQNSSIVLQKKISISYKANEENEKFLNSYSLFIGKDRNDLNTAEMTKIYELITGESFQQKYFKNICVEFYKALKNLPARIEKAGPPSVKNGRIYSETIQGIPEDHTVEVMLPNLLVTYDGTHSHIYELQKKSVLGGGIEAVPCLKYGMNNTHCYPGKCLGVSTNTNIIVLHRPDKDEIKMLSNGTEKYFTTSDLPYFKDCSDRIFYESAGECIISPDGKSLSFLFRYDNMDPGTLVRGFSHTPLQTDTFILESIKLIDYGGHCHYGDCDKHIIYHMVESIDHTWSIVAGYSHGNDHQLFFLPLPLSELARCRDQESHEEIVSTVLLDNTIAIADATAGTIEIFDSDTSVRAACKISGGEIYKMESSPDGSTLVVLFDVRPGSAFYRYSENRCAIGCYQIPLEDILENTSETDSETSTNLSLFDYPELLQLWTKSLTGLARDYHFKFMDSGTKLVISKRSEPGVRTIWALTN
jgi:hypothetical protein